MTKRMAPGTIRLIIAGALALSAAVAGSHAAKAGTGGVSISPNFQYNEPSYRSVSWTLSWTNSYPTTFGSVRVDWNFGDSTPIYSDPQCTSGGCGSFSKGYGHSYPWNAPVGTTYYPTATVIVYDHTNGPMTVGSDQASVYIDQACPPHCSPVHLTAPRRGQINQTTTHIAFKVVVGKNGQAVTRLS